MPNGDENMATQRTSNTRVAGLGALAAILLAALATTMVQCRDKSSEKSTAASKPSESAMPAQPPLSATRASAPSTSWSDWKAPPEDALDTPHRRTAQELMDKAALYLVRQRDDSGSWSTGKDSARPAITAMVLKALVQHPGYGPGHPAVRKGFEALLSFKQSDGGIYEPSEGGSSYTSAVALMALAAVQGREYDQQVRDLIAHLRSLQIVPGAESTDGKVDANDPRVGGVGYGKGSGKPDLSVTGMWAEALHEGGVPADDPAMQRAVAFVSRLQNNSETNSMLWAKEGDSDGGFVYVMPGQGPGGSSGGQGARSYGSMTYTGFKSLLYAGVDHKDQRVQAAFRWIREHWRLDSNPNMPAVQSKSGLYYYYHVFAKALDAWGEPVIADIKGVKHNWRHELIDALAAQVRDDGSWVNTADRWWEGSPVLTTSYAMLALEEALKPIPVGKSQE